MKIMSIVLFLLVFFLFLRIIVEDFQKSIIMFLLFFPNSWLSERNTCDSRKVDFQA